MAYFGARFSNSGKYDPVAANSEVTQMFELSPGNNVKTASHLREMLQDGKIPIGFHGETKRVRSLSQTAIELLVSIGNGRAAIEIRRRSKFLGGLNEVNALAENVFNFLLFSGFFPCELWREFSRVDKHQFFTRIGSLRAHRTFNTTSVRSSDSGALCANQSTSRKSRSASSVALIS